MKSIKKLILGTALVAASLGACTDDFDKTNMNPNKIYTARPEFVFPGVVYNSMKTLQEMNYRWFATLAQYNVHWSEQKDTEDMNFFEGFYVRSLKDLVKLEDVYVGNEEYANVGNMLMTWKCYLYYIMVTTWGNVPMSEANAKGIQVSYKYDSEEEIYNYLLTTLDEVVKSYNLDGDKITGDPLFGGDIAKWRKFSNSLRLQIALTIQNMDKSLAEENIRKALTGGNNNYLLDSDVIFQFGTDLSNDASWVYQPYIQKFETGTVDGWGTYAAMSHNFFLYMRSYDDPRLPKFVQEAKGKEMSILQNDTLTRVNPDYPQFRDSLLVNYGLPYKARQDYKDVPSGWIVATDPSSPTGETYRSPFGNVNKGNNECLVNYDFVKVNSIIPLLTVAEVNFMKAEVAVKFPGILGGTAQQYYEDGVRASMKQWGVNDADVTAYQDKDGVKWNTNGNGLWEYRRFFKADIKGQGGNDGHLEQIYKQWYIANFFNGHAGWTLERRTRAIGFPPHFFNGAVPTEGSNGICEWMMERFTYPINEQSANAAGYAQAVIDLQKTSPAPNPVRGGDNYFTLLRIAAPQPNGGNLSSWLSGEIIYDGKFVFHWYGSTLEEVFATTGASSEEELKELIRYEVVNIKSTYNPENGKVMIWDDETGEWIEKPVNNN